MEKKEREKPLCESDKKEEEREKHTPWTHEETLYNVWPTFNQENKHRFP